MVIEFPGLHRIKTLDCTPDEARAILRAFLDEHPDKVDRLEETFRSMTMRMIRRNDLTDALLSGCLHNTQAVRALVIKEHPILGAKLDMLADLLYDRWLTWRRDLWKNRGRLGVMVVPEKEPTEGGPAAAGHEGA
ncbi:hypothetical protein MARCHEWKA_02890 [Brevundimonas phage vB_BpoS-Marchewka]|uniref:Uncharacterized protein n=1 Tax=Brevundimonas phage vB_BpoS-Marchewka TaxID=2948604 RepID=A0A9E7N5Y0_9CAUD|nr:hypothetical protein MARCHEWKA_02890 [Brevundimonas phage vB_BpoS-Marchewka]UTC29248.1 hypothetical protein BAMBUS_01660 [Brevundimonas phage vB_BpoS-Bambus]